MVKFPILSLLFLAVFGGVGLMFNEAAAGVPGDLDSSFGSYGLVHTQYPGSSGGFGNAVVLQKDGKIVVAGTCQKGGSYDTKIALQRYLADGSLDPDFGVGGMVSTAISPVSDYGSCMALQSDGKILVGGYSERTAVEEYILLRFNADGSADTSFDGDGIVTADLSVGSYDQATTVIVLSNGKILLSGMTFDSIVGFTPAFVRYNANGSLDATFGTGGKVISDFSMENYSMAMQSDGKMVVAGDSHLLVRFNANGTLDTTFGTGGMVDSSFAEPFHGIAKVAIQSNGKIVVLGNPRIGSAYRIALARFNTNGTVDTVFGTNGLMTTPAIGNSDYGYGLFIQKDGKILATGVAGKSLVVARYNANGNPDATFGTGGAALASLFNEVRGFDVTVQPDGKIVVAGAVTNNLSGNGGAVVARFMTVATAPEITVRSPTQASLADGGSFSFGNVGAGAEKFLTFSIANTGTDMLTGVSVNLSGANADQYQIATAPEEAVPPGAVTTFVMRYTPSGLGKHTAAIEITSNDANENPFNLTISGTGITPPPLQPKALAATAILVESATLNGSVDPLGTTPLMSFEYGLTTSYGIIVDADPGTVSGFGPAAVSAQISGLLPHTKYFYRLRVLGSEDLRTSAGLSFTTANRPPVAVMDNAAVTPGAAVTLNVLANDGDDPGEVLSLVSHAAVPAAKGKVAKVGGNLIFTAATTFNGASFTYVVKDNFGGTATGQVNLSVADSSIDPPAKNVISAGGTHVVDVTTAAAWAVNEAVAWITTAATGPDEVQVTVQPNAALAARTATILIAGKPHVITQAGVSIPGLTQPATVPGAMISIDYALAIPTMNGPVTYTATNLPPGLTINQTTGSIGGRPTRAGAYEVKIKARNLAGPAPGELSFSITVSPLPDGVAGAYLGYVAADTAVNGGLGSRFEMTATSTGTVSGKVISGVAAKSFTGKWHTDMAIPNQPTFTVAIGAPLNQVLTLVREVGTLSRTAPGLPVTAWRQTWKAVINPATAYKGLHTFYLSPPAAVPNVPQGDGFGSFIVDENTGALKISGKLVDGNALLTSAVLGPQGQVLIYQALYGNKGVFGGLMRIDTSHHLAGTALWSRPGVFGPAECILSGGAYVPLAPGEVVMGLPALTNNAILAFSKGGLEVEDKEFDIVFTLLNPSPTGLTNNANFSPLDPNNVTLTSVNTDNGVFAGEFMIFGATAAQDRKVAFQGQIVWDAAGSHGHGFFLLPDPVNATIKRSGRVVLGPVE